MSTLTKALAALLLTCCLGVSHAQNTTNPVTKLPFETGTWKLYTSDTSGVVNVLYANDDEGIAFLRENGQLEKDIRIPGAGILGLGKFKGNILVFYSPERVKIASGMQLAKLIDNIHAVLIDAKTKTIVLDKVVYTNSGNYYVVPEIDLDSRGELDHFLVRITLAKGGRRRMVEYEEINKNKFSAIDEVLLSDNLEAVKKPLSSTAIGGAFIAACTGVTGEQYMVSVLNDLLIAEKFDRDGRLQKKLTTATDIGIIYEINPQIRIDIAHGDVVYLGLDYLTSKKKNELGVFGFDFNKEKVWSPEPQLLNRAYRKEIEEIPADKKGGNFDGIENLLIVDILLNGDQVIVVKDIQLDRYLPSHTSQFFSGASLISVYDRQLKLLHDLPIYRAYNNTSVIKGKGLACCFRNGKLRILGEQLNFLAPADTHQFTLDLTNYTIEKKPLERPASLLRTTVMDPPSIFWFRDGALTFNFRTIGLKGMFAEVHTQLIPYE